MEREVEQMERSTLFHLRALGINRLEVEVEQVEQKRIDIPASDCS
jgi:hypothetical protein